MLSDVLSDEEVGIGSQLSDADVGIQPAKPEPLDFSKLLARPGQLDAAGNKPYAGYLSAGPFSAYQPENMQEAVNLISSLQEPPVRIPRIKAESTLGKLAAAPVNVASGLAEGLTSPVGVLSTLAGGPVVKGLFAGLAAKEAGRALGEASVTKDPGQLAEGVLSAGIAPWIALHGTLSDSEVGLRPARPPEAVKPVPEVAPTVPVAKAPVPETKPVELAPAETPPLAVTPETIRAEFDKYDSTGEHKTINDLVTQIEVMAEQDPQAPASSKLRDAVDRFRDDQEADRELAGRGDMDEAEEKFLRRLKRAANFAEKEAKNKPAPVAPKTETPVAPTEAPVVLTSKSEKIPPNSSFIEVVDYDGNLTARVALPHNGTPEGAVESAKRVQAHANRNFAWKSEFYNTNSRLGATDANGKLKWVISPNMAHVAEAGTKEARYILGDLSAHSEPVETPKEFGDKTVTSPVTEPPTTLVETPVQASEAKSDPNVAAAKMELQVAKIERTGGQRPAKEAKSELVSRLEKAIDDAPSEEAAYKTAIEKAGAKVSLKATDYEKQKADIRSGNQLNKVTIDIPGDGMFTVWNTKKNLSELLDRAKQISTDPGKPKPVRRTGMSQEDKAFVQEHLANPQPISAGPGAASPGDVPLATQESQLMDALSKLPPGKEGRDSPQIAVADRIAASVGAGKTAIDKWWLRTKAGAGQYKRLLFGAPRSEDGFWSVKKDWQANKQVNSGVAREMLEAGKKTFPKQIHRQAMNKWLEAQFFDDPEATLREWESGAKQPADRVQYQAAQKLTDAQRSAALQARQYWEAKGQELQQAGLLPHLIEDYAGQHMVDMRASKPPAELNQLRADLVRGTFNTNFKYALRRLFQTEYDLEQAGYKLKTTDLFDKLANYAKTANDVLNDRASIKRWMDNETADGKPLFATGQHRIPIEGAKNDALLVNPKVRPNPVWENKSGEKVDIGGEYVKIDHPAFKKWQWAETDPAGKQIFVQGDVWAHKSIADELKNTMGRSHLYDIPLIDTATRANAQLKGIKLVGFFHQVKTGSHALFHLTNPFGQPKVNPHDPFVYEAMRSGLQLFESRNQEMFSEGAASSTLLQGLANIPKTVTGIDALGFGDRLRAYQEYLFQDYIPRIKLATYRNALERNLQRYPELPPNEAKQITATQVNSAFGELNWRLMGINPTFQHFLRLALLAPDFQAAQHGFAAQIFTKYGGEQRMAAAIMIASVYTGARILNQIFDNDPHWELKRAFSVVHGGREYGIRTIASDAQRAFTDTSQYIYHRLSPIASSAAEFVSKTSAMGRKETGGEAAKNIALRAVPIPLTPRQDIGFVENAISSTLGVYNKKHSAMQDISQIGHDWRKANDPAYPSGAVQYPDSPYRDLRNALENNDLAAARKEYQKLAKARGDSNIFKAMAPTDRVAGIRSDQMDDFIKSLSPEERKVYNMALKERENTWNKFLKIAPQ